MVFTSVFCHFQPFPRYARHMSLTHLHVDS